MGTVFIKRKSSSYSVAESCLISSTIWGKPEHAASFVFAESDNVS